MKYYIDINKDKKYFKFVKYNSKNKIEIKTNLSLRLAGILKLPITPLMKNFKNVIFLYDFNPNKREKGYFNIKFKKELIPCWFHYFKHNNKYLIHVNKDIYYKNH